MPRLACRACGRQIYATAPFESLFAEERRCPRCQAALIVDRRGGERRTVARRVNFSEEPGPPVGTGERRFETRRQGPRRQTAARTSTPVGSSAGWVD
ncbi:MAG TPA: hypothetical protein VGJ17_01500 [Candidatus Limnocylindrales bacterium]